MIALLKSHMMKTEMEAVLTGHKFAITNNALVVVISVKRFCIFVPVGA